MVLPEEFKAFPPQAVDIRIAGLVPFKDTTWDKISTQLVKEWLNLSEKFHFEGAIVLALMNCIWVKDVEVKEKLRAIKEETKLFFVKEKLIKTKNAIADQKAMEILLELAKAAGMIQINSIE